MAQDNEEKIRVTKQAKVKQLRREIKALKLEIESREIKVRMHEYDLGGGD